MPRPLVRSLLALALCALLALPVLAASGDTETMGWVCPPCVHSDLDVVYDEPGSCPICGMDLVPRGDLTYVAILLFDGVQIIDFAGPYEVFGQASFYVYTVSHDGAPVTTAMDMRVVPHFGFDDAPRPDVLLVPGGNVDPHLGDETTLGWIRARAADADHVLSVCNGAFLLARAGLLDGLQATTFHRVLDDLARDFRDVEVLAGARFVDNGKVVTSAGLSAGLDAALHLVAKIRGAEYARDRARHLEYDWREDPGVAEASVLDRPLAPGRLHDYDGLYQYENGGRVRLAGSPEDHRLYALLDGERYPVAHLDGDRFLNVAGEEVVFERGSDGTVTGFRKVDEAPEVLYRRLESSAGS